MVLPAVGDWAADADVEQISVDVDRSQAWTQGFAPGAVTPTRTGVLASAECWESCCLQRAALSWE